MGRALGIMAAIICCLVLLFMVPVNINKNIKKVSEDALADKMAQELAYQIESEKVLHLYDIYSYEGTICAYNDYVGGEIVMVSWEEICDVLRADGKYEFTEKYVQLEYADKRLSLRVN